MADKRTLLPLGTMNRCPLRNMAGPETAYMSFPDGNIIVSTKDQEFRVHRGVLEMQSAVWKKTFEARPLRWFDLIRTPKVYVSVSAKEVDMYIRAAYGM